MRDGFVPIGGERAEKRTVSFHRTTIVGGPGNEARAHTLCLPAKEEIKETKTQEIAKQRRRKCEEGRFRFLFLPLPPRFRFGKRRRYFPFFLSSLMTSSLFYCTSTRNNVGKKKHDGSCVGDHGSSSW